MEPRREIRARDRLTPARFRNTGEALAWLGGLVLALSSFMGWYSVSVGSFSLGEESSLSLLGWHSGVLGKLVFFVGLAVAHVIARRAPMPGLVLAAFYLVLLVFFLIAAGVVAALGVVEQWIGVRNRVAVAGPPGRSE